MTSFMLCGISSITLTIKMKRDSLNRTIYACMYVCLHNIHKFEIINNINFEIDHRMIGCKMDIIKNKYQKFTVIKNKLTTKLSKMTLEKKAYWEKKS